MPESTQITGWTVQLVRLTFFPAGRQTVDPDLWWQAVVGELPDQIQAWPRQQRAALESDYGLGRLKLEILPDRATWKYEVQPASESDDETLITLGSLDVALATFSQVSERWFAAKECPPVSRIAFGAILETPVSDYRTGIQTLDQYLPSVELDPSSSNFLYQINRPRQATIGLQTVDINRLSQWKVITKEVQGFVFSAGEIKPVAPVMQAVACRLELDINTGAGYEGIFTPGEQKQVFSLLVRYGSEIAEKGDMP
jgi:hypothetical protein